MSGKGVRGGGCLVLFVSDGGGWEGDLGIWRSVWGVGVRFDEMRLAE
jgi:hypothetical protein